MPTIIIICIAIMALIRLLSHMLYTTGYGDYFNTILYCCMYFLLAILGFFLFMLNRNNKSIDIENSYNWFHNVLSYKSWYVAILAIMFIFTGGRYHAIFRYYFIVYLQMKLYVRVLGYYNLFTGIFLKKIFITFDFYCRNFFLKIFQFIYGLLFGVSALSKIIDLSNYYIPHEDIMAEKYGLSVEEYRAFAGTPDDDVWLSRYYKSAKYIILHYSIIILWFFPADCTFFDKWKILMLKFQVNVIERFMADSIECIPSLVTQPVFIKSNAQFPVKDATPMRNIVPHGMTDHAAEVGNYNWDFLGLYDLVPYIRHIMGYEPTRGLGMEMHRALYHTSWVDSYSCWFWSWFEFSIGGQGTSFGTFSIMNEFSKQEQTYFDAHLYNNYYYEFPVEEALRDDAFCFTIEHLDDVDHTLMGILANEPMQNSYNINPVAIWMMFAWGLLLLFSVILVSRQMQTCIIFHDVEFGIIFFNVAMFYFYKFTTWLYLFLFVLWMILEYLFYGLINFQKVVCFLFPDKISHDTFIMLEKVSYFNCVC